jgi:hypothetical protein
MTHSKSRKIATTSAAFCAFSNLVLARFFTTFYIKFHVQNVSFHAINDISIFHCNSAPILPFQPLINDSIRFYSAVKYGQFGSMNIMSVVYLQAFPLF